MRCSAFALLCLRFAQIAALLGVLSTIGGGLVLLARKETIMALYFLFILTPVAIGGFVAFGLAIKYAKYE